MDSLFKLSGIERLARKLQVGFRVVSRIEGSMCSFRASYGLALLRRLSQANHFKVTAGILPGGARSGLRAAVKGTGQ